MQGAQAAGRAERKAVMAGPERVWRQGFGAEGERERAALPPALGKATLSFLDLIMGRWGLIKCLKLRSGVINLE